MSPRQKYALLLLGCASAACEQEHVLLGSLPTRDAELGDAWPTDAGELDSAQPTPAQDATVLDASLPSDAEPDTSGEGLQLEFMANRITGVTQLRGCLGACTEVRVMPRGGRPPYDVQWDDGSRSLTRQLCATESTSGYSVSLRDQDSPALPEDSGVIDLVGFQHWLYIEPRDCSGDAGTPGEWDVCFAPTRVKTSCAAPAPAAREEIFLLPEQLPPSADPSIQLSLGGLLLPETIQVMTSQTGCASSSELYLAVGTSILSQVVSACGPPLDARYLHVWTMNANTSVGPIEICQRCR